MTKKRAEGFLDLSRQGRHGQKKSHSADRRGRDPVNGSEYRNDVVRVGGSRAEIFRPSERAAPLTNAMWLSTVWSGGLCRTIPTCMGPFLGRLHSQQRTQTERRQRLEGVPGATGQGDGNSLT